MGIKNRCLDPGGYSVLLRFIDSNQFTIFHTLLYLERYADEIGIHFHVANKLRGYSDKEIEFFVPQIVQLHVTVKTESMALEELILELCDRSTHVMLLVFWQVQAHLSELLNEPESYGFQVCRRLVKKLQHVLFNLGQSPENQLFENTHPSLVLAGSVAAAFGLPGTVEYIKPLVVSQGRKKRTWLFPFTAFQNGSSRPSALGIPDVSHTSKHGYSLGSSHLQSPQPFSHRYSRSSVAENSLEIPDLASHMDSQQFDDVSSLPDMYNFAPSSRDFSSSTCGINNIAHSSLPPSVYLYQKHIQTLKSNYFYCETQFMDSLQKITNKLMQVPKQARLSALRVEIAMLNKDLPAEVDIPLLLSSHPFPNQIKDLPAKQNRVVRIVPSEAVLLNSAERIPYLLLVEYLHNDIDFDPLSEQNRPIVTHELNRKHIFDTRSGPATDQYFMSVPSSVRNSEDFGFQRFRASPSNSSKELAHNTQNFTHFVPQEIFPSDEESDIGKISAVNLFETQTDLKLNHNLPFSSTGNGTFSYGARNGRSTRPSSMYVAPSRQSFRLPSSSVSATPARYDDTDAINDLATHMRTAAIMINQLDNSKLSKEEIERIKNKIVNSMQGMEEKCVGSGICVQDEAGVCKLENDLLVTGMDESLAENTVSSTFHKDAFSSPEAVVHAAATAASKGSLNLGEDWKAKKERIRRASPYGHYPNWDLFSCIVKTGSDLRQEAFACQLIQAMQTCWNKCNTGVWVKTMRILITNNSAGLVETITNALSIHSIKKAMSAAEESDRSYDIKNSKRPSPSLKSFFEITFGSSGPKLDCAIDCFVCSLAAYSIICYLLQIKDRHNGNIMLDNKGHIIHVDFGFLLSNSPGKVGFETSSFKLTHEYIELMGGVGSQNFIKFKGLMKKAFKDIRKEAENIIILVNMMQKDSRLPCFASGASTVSQLRQRFQLQMSDSEVENFVENQLVYKSLRSLSTRLYDQYQFLTQGICS